MVSEATKRYRELFAWAILAYLLASLLFEFIALFVDRGFADNSALQYTEFVDPVVSGLLVLAVVLVSHVEAPTANARSVTLIALALVASLMLLGLVTWMAGLASVDVFGSAASKMLGSLEFLLRLALMGAAGWFVFLSHAAVHAQAHRHASPHSLPSLPFDPYRRVRRPASTPAVAAGAGQGWGQRAGGGAAGEQTTPQTAWTAAKLVAQRRRHEQSETGRDTASWWVQTWGQTQGGEPGRDR